MSTFWPPLWEPDSNASDYDEGVEGPEAQMWRSVASAAASLGYHQANCPVCTGKGWIWVVEDRTT